MRVGILGGGMMGLWLGYRLSKKGLSVHILEKENKLGGLATWFDYGPFIWDKFYHVILQQDKNLIELIEALNLSSHLTWKETKTGFLWNNQSISMSNTKELLTFPALNALEKLRLVTGLLRCQFFESQDTLHSVKAPVWLTKIFGENVYKTIWEPLLESKFGSLKNQIPASILYSTIMRYRSTRKAASGKELIGSLQGGLKILFDKLQSEILQMGGKISCNCLVKTIKDTRPIQVQSDNESFTFDRLINTLPSAIFNTMLGKNKPTKTPQFLGVICYAAILNKALSPYYITNLIDKGYPFTGIIEPANAVNLQGHHLLMLPRYDVPESPWFQKQDAEIKKEFLQALQQIHPGIEKQIERSFVHRAKQVQALWIDTPPPNKSPIKSSDGAIFSINSELLEGSTLSNDSIISIAKIGLQEFL